MIFLEQSSSPTVLLGPFVDETTGKDAETGLTITQSDVQLSKNAAALAQKNESTSATHRGNGFYSVPLNGTDTATLGILTIAIHESGALPVWLTCHILTSNVYDSLFGSGDLLQVDVREFSLSSLALTTQMKADVKTQADQAFTDYDPPTFTEMDDAFGALVNPSLDDIADAVWDEDIVAAHNAGDSAGALLDDLGTPANFMANIGGLNDPNVDEIADAVWDEDIVNAHNDANSAGALLDDLATPADFKADVTPLDTPSNFMANVASLATSGEIAALENASLDDIADAVWDEDIVAAHNAGDSAGALLDDLGTPADFMASPPSAATIADAVWLETLTDHSGSGGSTAEALAGASAPSAAAVADAVWTETLSDHSGGGGSTAEALAAAGSGADADAIADAVWSETLADHSGGSGSTAEALDSAGSGADADAIADAVWNEDIVAAHNAADSAGALLDDLATPADFKANVTNLDASVASRSSHSAAQAASAVWEEDIVAAHNTPDSAGALLDDLGTPADFMANIAGLENPTLDDIADAVWDEDIVAAHNAGDSAGALLDDLGTPADFMANIGSLENASLDDIADAVWDEDIVAAHNAGDSAGALLDDLATPADFKANVTNLDASVASRSSHSAAQAASAVWEEDIVAGHNTPDSAGALLDDLGTPGDFMASPPSAATIADAVWLETLTDHSGSGGSTAEALAGASAPSAATVADAVWEEDITDHSGTPDSTAEALAGASAPSADAVADAVWDEDIVAAHNAGDSAGALLDDLATPADFKANVTNLDAAITTRATPAQVNTQAAAALATYDPPTKAELDSGLAGLSDPTAAAIADAVWDEDIVGAHNASDSAGALLDDLSTPADFKADVSALATAAGLASLNDPTAAAIADAVWDEPIADHQDTGSTGKTLSSSSAGTGATTFVYTLTSTIDSSPIADADIWVTSDVDGDIMLASGRTNAQGKVTFYLDAGTYYVWRQKAGWNFTNPDTEVIP